MSASVSVILTTRATGEVRLPMTMPTGVPPGTELWVQYALLDAGAINGVSLSNALLGLTP